MKKKIIIDLFAGAGGESCGIHKAFEERDENIQLFAVNHWERACETHAANFPADECICQDIQTVIPTSLVHPGEQVELMWASPECFTSETLVLTARGYLPISEVMVGDIVLTHKNRWRKVTSVMKSIKPVATIKGYGHFGLETTARHPFYVATRKKILHHRSVESVYSEPRFSKVSEIKSQIEDKNISVYWCKPSFIEPLDIPQVDAVNGREFKVDDRLLWFAGRYVADGYVRIGAGKHEITISCGKSKYNSTRQMLNRWGRSGARAKSDEIVWHEHKVRTAMNFTTDSKGIAEWLVNNFGKNADGKFIPSWLYGAEQNLREAFISGYMSGDGSITDGVCSVTTVSKRLAFGFATLISTIGINPQVYKPKHREHMVIEGRPVKCRQQYSVKWRINVNAKHCQTPSFDKDHLWAPIRKVEGTDQIKEVYNISVEEDESYVVEGICVHNCTHFSTARGGKPMDDQSRCTPFDIIRWVTMLNIKRLVIENVPEFQTWGPLNEQNRPIKEQRGGYFAMFINSLRGCGYQVDWRVLNAADYGAPTTRRRLFIQAVKKGSGKSLVWPEATNAEHPASDLFGSELHPWVPASEIIDWSIPCIPIDDREKPLSANTWKRIMNGIKKYWGEYAEPFLVRYNGGDNRHHSVNAPVPTLDTSNRYGLVQPLIAEMYGTGGCKPTTRPVSTISCSGAHHALVQPLITAIGQTSSPNRTRSTREPLSTICTKQEHCLIEPLIMEYYGNGQCRPVTEPLGTVTCKDRFALLSPENCRIGFRMLQPHELAKAQSFPDGYIFTGTKTEVVKQIGNAVCPKIAEALAI